ncbi:MAG: hypothetical protein HN686_08715 [Bacteroidetes bacterium]|nr:hypothetical protein [Bacteroidota bacterium]
MKNLLTLLLIVLLGLSACNNSIDVASTDLPDISQTNNHYIGNQAPLVNTPFIKLPIGSIEPAGWVRKQLELQADGYFGHLGEISQFLIKENNSWLSTDGSGDHGWEELPYWLKGYSNLAYLLGREDMLKETQLWIEAVLGSQKDDGWFGPDQDRTGAATRLKGREDLWPNMVMLFILQDYYSYAKDERVISLMTNYFNYLQTIPEEKFLVGYWPANRGGDLLYSVYWLYNRTEDESLLELAHKVHKRSVNWTDGIANWHNVNMSQSFGQPGTYYMQTQETKHLEAANRNFNEIRELYGQVPGGMFGSDENCREGYIDPRQAVETCGMVEMMLSTEILFTITGDPVWAERCEDVAFNSYPAALTADMKALRYLQSPNMVQSDKVSKSPGIQNGGPMFQMNPNRHRCCQHNQGHGWPYFAEHLWLATADNGLAVAFYSENKVTAMVGKGIEVSISEQTNYPFEEQIEFSIEPSNKVRFPLYLRVPSWCEKPVVSINGEEADYGELAGYIRIEKTWEAGDKVSLSLPMKLNLRTWEANKNSVSVDYGPLTFSLKIEEDYVQDGGTEEWPAWEIYPASPWNYALVLNSNDPLQSFEVIKRDYPASDMPFTHEGAPIMLKAKGKIIPDWGMDENNLIQELPDNPVVTEETTDEIILIPMGAARLRISSFPVVK